MRLIFCLLAAAWAFRAAALPPVAPPAGPQAGARLQRSLALMAASTPERRNTVKVLFYGQSITEQGWWRIVADDLRARFPHANLIIENRAIGGHASQLLVKTAEADVYPFQPDLLIFHVYGAHNTYEELIRHVRKRTTADILVQTDHITRDAMLTEETDPAKLTPKQWDAWMNHSFLPATAAKYGCERADIHERWKAYLKANGLPAAKFLRDAVHLNADGEWLMAELIKPYLRCDPALAGNVDTNAVRTFVVGRDVAWRDGVLRLEFDGSRMDAVCAPGGAPPVEVLIDGKRPSEFPELCSFTRASPYPGSNWPALLKVGSQAPRVAEDWTLTVTEINDAHDVVRFRVQGSVTGPDGDGVSTNRFVSGSGRVVIGPDDWNLAYGRKVFGRPLPAGFAVTWRAAPQFTDSFTSPGVEDPAVETTVTLAQGLPNGRHTLELRAVTPPATLAALRVYRPPLRAAE